jgi:purine-nucleoside phosphorylase
MYPDVRLASTSDVKRMLEIEERSFPSPWDRELLLECIMGPGCRTWTAVSDGILTGYVSCRLEPDGLHILNLAVHPSHRGMGFASALLQHSEDWGSRLGAHRVFLEVREGSLPARRLYSKRGYSVACSLGEYYSDGSKGLRLEKGIRPDFETARMAEAIAGRCDTIPSVGVVLGSGLAWLAEETGVNFRIGYDEIMESSLPEVPGHPGELAFSSCGRYVFLLGRRHHYQGYGGTEISILQTVLCDLGVRYWILTSSSGAVDPSLEPGDAVLFRDHVNFTGCIPDMVRGRVRPSVYSERLRDAAKNAAEEAGTDLGDGVFACVSGPAYETSVEIDFLQRKGISTVSMSTAPEALRISSLGMEVAGLSLVTNSAVPGAVLTHEEVLSTQSRIRKVQGRFLQAFLRRAAIMGSSG